MVRGFGLAAVGLLLFVLGFIFGSVIQGRRNFEPQKVLAIKWGPSSTGQASVGVVVFLDRYDDPQPVRARLLKSYSGEVVDLGVIGNVGNEFDAATKFGTIEFRKDGLHVGSYFLKQADLEAKLKP